MDKGLVGGRVAVVLVALGVGCGDGAKTATLPLRRVVVYRNGVGYFERQGRVRAREVDFRVKPGEVGDFLATLTVMERGGSTVRAVAFPVPEEDGGAGRRRVRLALDGARHDLRVGYSVETPIWRPSYRLVYQGGTAHLQAWGIVQNLSGEDWTDVSLSLVAGAPVSFRSDLARAVIPARPEVDDRGAVIDAVPVGDVTLAQGEAGASSPARAPAAVQASPGGAMGGAEVVVQERVPRGVVRVEAAVVSGPLGAEGVQRELRRHLGQVRSCYERSLRGHPGLQGRVVLRFSLGPSGRVTGANVVEDGLPDARVGACVANAALGWQFSPPQGGGVVDVAQPLHFAPEDGVVRAPTAAVGGTASSEHIAPRTMASLAATAVQGGVTRWDLPQRVTVPDRSATMVMLTARDVPGARMYLYGPDPGVPDAQVHPFQVARFVNRTGALLERGPVAIFEDGAFLGQGMLDPLPDGASATVPFALERGLRVESSATDTVEGARLVSMQRETVNFVRFSVRRTTWRVVNGLDQPARVMLRQALDGAELHEPPSGTERASGHALVPVQTPARGRAEVVVTTRRPFAVSASFADPQASAAVAQYLQDGQPAADVASTLRAALALRERIDVLSRARDDTERRRDDLQRGAEETRENLRAIQRNPQAADLRGQLTVRLARAATEVDQLTRRVVELDTQCSEQRVRLTESLRGLERVVAAPAPTTP